MKVARIFAIGLFCCASVGNAQDLIRTKDLHFQCIFASKPGDEREYTVLGSGWLRVIQFGDPGDFVAKWLAAHPAAIVTPIGKIIMTNLRDKKQDQLVYIWIDDGESSLNVDLVRAGVFPGGVMHDMVDSYKYMNEQIKDPRLASTKKEIEKERAENLQDEPVRIVTDAEYNARLQRIDAAEAAARTEKLGIWSDAMKEERESEGYQ